MDQATQFFRVKLIGGDSKRVFDVILSAFAIVILAPLMAMIYLLIVITDGRPAIIRHRRLGPYGSTFPCLKFRTMVVDAAEVLARHLDSNPEAREEWLQNHKLRNDPRITVFGAILRKTSLDELPQFFNVLLGHMSLVGPRPITPDEVRHYKDAMLFYCQTRPGITGLWQVSGRNRVSYSQRVKLDEEYVANWSFKRDLVILMKTVVCVVRMDGS
ncbi:exopolysaccharide production protein ExoY [Microvirga flocculans]|uniref:Exopolysaccharide production protein ExoY n=1 Tax=Microvirga flocculans TaxID=217168 RepID=A0A7W6IHF6_9HYPH|nr:sugar transferase [Microvirga flocculans]MBB4041556.1 exopolysaccharide production protein ExoY [Microvirga flocculans]